MLAPQIVIYSDDSEYAALRAKIEIKKLLAISFFMSVYSFAAAKAASNKSILNDEPDCRLSASGSARLSDSTGRLDTEDLVIDNTVFQNVYRTYDAKVLDPHWHLER